jgi:hypothetical protein
MSVVGNQADYALEFTMNALPHAPLSALHMFFIYFAPDQTLVAAFADANEAINYVLAHHDTYGFVPNQDLIITDASAIPKLSVL